MDGMTPASFARSVAVTLGAAGALCAVGAWNGWARFGPQGEVFAGRLRTGELNQADATLLQRGYYENLMGAGRLNSQLFDVLMGEPPRARFDDSEASRPRDDFLAREVVPGIRTAFLGAPFSTNRWGMRDRDYEQEPPPGVFRFALMGESGAMGWGVADTATYEARLEAALQRDAAAAPHRGYEVLNFAVANYSPPQQLMLLPRVLEFRPDVVLYTAHEMDDDRAVSRLLTARLDGVRIPFDTLQRAADRALAGTTTREVGRQRLHPYRFDLLRWIYGGIVRQCREAGVLPVWAFIPTLERRASSEDVDVLARIAAEAGFVVADLRDVYGDADLRTLWLMESDRHPNAAGHAMIGAALNRALRATPALQHDLPPANPDSLP